MKPSELTLHPISDLPLVSSGDDLAALIAGAMERLELVLEDGDVLVVAQKIVSKAEGRLVRLSDVDPSQAAIDLGAEVAKDPRLVELILRESSAVVRKKPGVLIVRHRHGLVSANAGIDQSNVEHEGGDCALLLPVDADASARELQAALRQLSAKQIGVIVSDSMNRPWRLGSVGTAIGSAGVSVLDDRRGHRDLYSRELTATVSNRADAIAAAAVLLMGEATEGIPAVLVRGLPTDTSTQRASECVRPVTEDLFL